MLDKYINSIEHYVLTEANLIRSTTFKENIKFFFKKVKQDKTSGAYKLITAFSSKDVTPQTWVYFFSSFIVVNNKIYFYVIPTSVKNRGSKITFSKNALVI